MGDQYDEGHGADLLRLVPFTLKVGHVGAGVGLGCGVGLGFGQPLNLGGIPGVGPVAYGLTSGLSQVAGTLGGVGHGARDAIRRLGVKGLDAGLGCGVGIGYGFGAGLFLKPSAAEQLLHAAQAAAGHVIAQLQTALHSSGIAPHLKAAQGVSTPAAAAASGIVPVQGSSAPGPSLSLPPTAIAATDRAVHPALSSAGAAEAAALHHSLPLQLPASSGEMLPPALHSFLPPALSGAHGGLAGMLGASGAAPAPAALPQQWGSGGPPVHGGYPAGAAATAASPDVYRTLLQHERELQRLRRQNQALRTALCQKDKRLPLCRQQGANSQEGSEWG